MVGVAPTSREPQSRTLSVELHARIRLEGIEPSLRGYQPRLLPLKYRRESGRRGLHPRSPPWQRGILLLDYAHDELGMLDSNQHRLFQGERGYRYPNPQFLFRGSRNRLATAAWVPAQVSGDLYGPRRRMIREIKTAMGW